MATSTISQVLKLGTAANSLTDFSNYVGDVDIGQSATTLQSLGSRAYEQHTAGGVRSFTFSATLEDAPAVNTFMNGKIGTVVYFEHGPGGSATGQPKRTGSIVVNSIQSPSPFQDRRTWTIQGAPASDLTSGAYA